MNKRLVLLLTAIFLAGAAGIDIPAQAVEGPFGYDLQKDLHRSKNKPQQQEEQKPEEQAPQYAVPVDVVVTDEDIFDNSSVNFNKAYYPNATMKSAAIKYKNGNYTGCLQELYTIVKKNPKNALAYYYAGMAYTQIGAVESAKNAYQRVVNLNTNPVLVEYAHRGQNCAAGNANCAVAGALGNLEGADELDKFIAAPYGTGLSPELTQKIKQQQLDLIQNKINNGNTLSPEDVKRMKQMQNKSMILSEDKLAMADTEKKNYRLIRKF